MSITITEAAANKVKELIKEANFSPDIAGLRFGIIGGGCAGFSYNIDLEDKPTDSDNIFEQFGVKIFCDKKSYLFLNGCEIDYQKTVMAQGFTIKNPNSKGGCGCGSSFSV